MRQRMQFNGVEIPFRRPFVIYDTISVFDKSQGIYVPRKRATAISFSDSSEILITSAICSQHDVFSKREARCKLEGRVQAALQHYLNNEAPHIYQEAIGNTGHIFADLDTFVQYCESFDSMSRQYFTPYSVQYASKITDQPDKKRVNSPSELYLHRSFVTDNYIAHQKALIAAEKADLDTTESPVKDISLQELIKNN